MVINANTPYKRAHGYAIKICWWSIEYAVTKSFDADTEHQIMQMAANKMPNVPLKVQTKKTKEPKRKKVNNWIDRSEPVSWTYCNVINTLRPDKTTIGNKQ